VGARRTKEAAEKALKEMEGAAVGQWRLRVGWAHHKQESEKALSADTVSKSDSTNNNVYVGNLSPEACSRPPTRPSSFSACLPHTVLPCSACLLGLLLGTIEMFIDFNDPAKRRGTTQAWHHPMPLVRVPHCHLNVGSLGG
jgi:hypothetical protein